MKPREPQLDLSRDIDFSKESRVPPYSLEVEQEVLACILLEDDPIEQVIQIFGDNGEAVFYEKRHQIIYKAMMLLYQKRQAIDLITVSEELSRIGELENIGGRPYLGELSGKVISSANIEFYARLVKEKYLYRRLISISSHISSAAYNTSMDIFDLVENASQQFFNISQAGVKKKATSIKELLKTATRMIENLGSSHSSVTGIGSGFSELDEYTAGFQPSDMIIIAARPSAGKTAFALALARNAAVNFNTPVLFFSLEMAEIQLALRLMCAEAYVESQLVRRGQISPEMMNKIINSMDALADAKLFIDDTPGISIMELTAKTRRMKQEHGIGMVVVDYLQLVTPVRDGRSNREQEIAQISRSLKALAKELNIPVIALAQLNRSVEQRSGDRRPQLSDLRESGSIEQDADMVIFLSRPEMYGIKNFEDGSSTKDITEVVIGKQRNGPIGTVRLLFLKKYGRFQSTANSYLTAADSGQQQPEPARGDGYPEASLPEPPPLDMDSFINNSDAAPFLTLPVMVYRKAPKHSGDAPDSSANPADRPASTGKERRYQGIGSAKGFAIGETYEFVRETIEHETADLSPENIEGEIERFMTALHRSEKELKKIERVTTRKIGRLYSDLFQAQIMLLKDPVLTGNITRRIRQELKPAHIVIEQEFGKLLEHFLNSDDVIFRERAADLHDLKERIIRNLHIRKLHSWVPEGSIVVSHHLSPADIILLSRSNIKGFATDTGGKTSHVSLICKSLNIPIVVGLGNFSQKAVSGERIILDGNEGLVITNPLDETVDTYLKKREEESKREADDSIMAHRHAFTRCGVRISVYSNIDFKEEIEHLDSMGAEGVGLFRTENLFLDDLKPPKEAAQQEYYRKMGEMLAPKPLVIRLFDIGGDKLIYSPVKEPNPNLGWRGVRILIDVPEILDAQLQAVIRANIHGNIDVLIPMISSVEEIMHIKQAVEEHYKHIRSLTTEPLDKPGIGAMIEVPAAVELIDEITQIVDFVSIGTNDLTQYTLAVDRNNLIVQDLFEKFHPAVIRQLHRVISTAQKNHCRVSLCGDMGSDPLATPYLIGCGLREFSIVSSDIPALKAMVGKYTVEECEALAAECLKLSSASAIKAHLEAFVKAH